MALQITTHNLEDVVVVKCAGRIVLGEETATLRETVKAMLDKSPHLVLDLSNVEHIDSNGIGMLVGLHVAASKVGAIIKLAGLMQKVKSVMETTRLTTIFEAYVTAEEAAASFAPAQTATP